VCVGDVEYGAVTVRVIGPQQPLPRKEQTHLWAPCSCSRWMTSADDTRGLTAAEPFLLTRDLGLE